MRWVETPMVILLFKADGAAWFRCAHDDDSNYRLRQKSPWCKPPILRSFLVREYLAAPPGSVLPFMGNVATSREPLLTPPEAGAFLHTMQVYIHGDPDAKRTA